MSDYIVQEGDDFYYWNDQDELVGPFKTLDQCEIAMDAASKWEAKDLRTVIKRMKEDMGL